jgi:hypothetical protein
MKKPITSEMISKAHAQYKIDNYGMDKEMLKKHIERMSDDAIRMYSGCYDDIRKGKEIYKRRKRMEEI